MFIEKIQESDVIDLWEKKSAGLGIEYVVCTVVAA